MLKQENVSGDIALRFFDHDGQECNTTLKERMISISMEQFKKIDRKISLVSGVSKANAVLSALNEYSNAIVHAFQGFRAPFSGKIVHIFPEQSAAFN